MIMTTTSMTKPFRASLHKDGFLVEYKPTLDTPVGAINIGRFDSFREAAQAAVQAELNYITINAWKDLMEAVHGRNDNG